jgi:methyl-accepting chemotaxis protein
MAVTDAEHITHAIAAHGMWKTRLRVAIDNGTCEMTVDQVRADDQCEFGRWLLGSPSARSSKHAPHIRELHAEFHRNAARVLELALKGEKAEAEAMMEPGSPFLQASADLTLAMVDWKKSLGAP